MERPLTADRVRALLDHLSDPASLHAADGTLLFANRALARSVGVASGTELVGLPTFDHIHRDDVDHVRTRFAAACAGAEDERPVQYRVRHQTHGWAVVESVATSYLDEPLINAVVITTRDVTERTEREHRLRTDELTGLANRAAALEQLGVDPVDGLVLVDLDAMKAINTLGGSRFGDLVLQVVAERLLAVAGGASVARLGGDEFLLAVRGEDPDDVAARVAATIDEVARVDGRAVRLRASIGTARAESGTTADRLLSDVGAAVRAAKARGGGVVVASDARLRGAERRRHALVEELRQAADDGTFAIAFQPIVCLPTGAVHASEALLRPGPGATWHVSEAVAAAEESGLIVPIGTWVTRAAIGAVAAAGGAARVSVNVSPRQLTDDRFLDEVWALLDAHEVAPSNVGFEVTESLAMRDIEGSIAALGWLRELGCRVGLDDFGTGHSSLAQLQRLPVDFIKLDGSFVAGAGQDRSARAIIEATVAMCDALGIDVIAEGVEHEAQRELVIDAGCRFAQGFLFGRPGPVIPPRDVHECRSAGRRRRFGRLVIDAGHRRVLVDDVERELTRREFDLLAELASVPGRVWSRGELLRRVWGSDPLWQDPSTVTEHVRRIRLKIEADQTAPRWVRTVHGVGYRFDP